MKYMILLGDGMADHAVPSLNNRTPLQAAHTPAMDAVAERGLSGCFWPIPEGLAPGSDIGNLSLFGYDPRVTFRGRAPIEVASQGITLQPNEVAFRCNLVTLADGKMASFTSDHISSDEASELIDALNEALTPDFPLRFQSGVSYRHACLIAARDDDEFEALLAEECTPPHDITDQDAAPHRPRGPAAGLLGDIARRAEVVLAAHPVNAARQQAKKMPANAIWLWGQGRAPEIATYQKKYGLSGAVISAVDLVRGIGVLAGLEVIYVRGATGWIDTNYAGKCEAALAALDRHDFVYLHVEAPDEAAHQGRADLKIQAIEDFDSKIVAPCLEALEQRGDLRILVAPDHYTLISTKTHAGGGVPFACCGAGVAQGSVTRYDEASAETSGIQIRQGHKLTERLLTEASLTPEILGA